MTTVQVIAALLAVAWFAAIVAWMIRSWRRRQEAQSQIQQALGFASIEPLPELRAKIAGLYHATRLDAHNPSKDRYQLARVAARHMPDCDLYLFDLLDTSGGETGISDRQAVAVISQYLDLPPFMIFPKADVDGSLSKLGDRFLGWLASTFGNPVDFPDFPEFNSKYLVSSLDALGTRQFLDADRLHALAHTRLLNIHACGDVFSLSHMEIQMESPTTERARASVNLALSLFRSWQKRGP